MVTKSLMTSMSIIIFLITFLFFSSFPAYAREDDRWSVPRQITEYDKNGRAPYLVADRNRAVHAFNVQSFSERESFLYYRKWTKERGWTLPVDIIIPPGLGSFSIEDVILGQKDIFHMIFFIGDNITGGIYYTKALAVNAGRAKSWSEPILIGESAGPVGSAAMVLKDNGEMSVVYAGRHEGIGLYEIYSNDEGNSWSRPQVIAFSLTEELYPNGVNLVQDNEGDLHLVWSIVNARGLGEGIYYTSFSRVNTSWQTPISLALLEDNDYSTTWPTITVYRDTLMVIYQDSRPATRWMRISMDRGNNWSTPERLFPHEGEYEYAVLLEDSAGVLHIVLGNRIGNPAIHGMWHSRWNGQRWSILEPIISGPRTSSFDPAAPTGVILQGNIMLVTWWNNVSAPNRTGAWYSYLALNAPELPAVPFSTNVSEIAIEPTSPKTTQQLVQTVTPLPFHLFDEIPLDQSPASPVFASIAPVGVLVSLLVISFWIRRKLYNR
jgi:hypothetical protein